jgi:large subunit ribosomal protein L18
MASTAEKRHSGRLRRQRRVRKKIHGTAERPRLAVFRSNKHLSAQLIDDDAGRTIASASSLEAEFRKSGSGATVDAAKRVGKTVVYDRGGFLYHGRIAAAAQAAREEGLEF